MLPAATPRTGLELQAACKTVGCKQPICQALLLAFAQRGQPLSESWSAGSHTCFSLHSLAVQSAEAVMKCSGAKGDQATL